MAAFATDLFTDTDATALESHTATGGGTWAKSGGAGEVASINSNKLCSSTSAGSASQTVWLHSATPPSADYEVEATIVVADGSHNTIALVARGVDNANFYGGFHLSNQGWYLYKRTTAGGGVNLGPPYNPGAATYQVKLRVEGTSLKLFIDGTERVNATDSDISAAGKAGVGWGYHGASVSTTTNLDGWSATRYPDTATTYDLTANILEPHGGGGLFG